MHVALYQHNSTHEFDIRVEFSYFFMSEIEMAVRDGQNSFASS
jgi:hypothetical protein